MRKVLLCLLILGAATLHAADTGFFIEMSDPQMGMFAKDANSLHEQANLQFAVDSINRLKPMFVVVSGDLVNRSGDPQEIAAYRSLIAKIDPAIPVYNVAGNHDVDNHPTPQTLATYRKVFGKDYYAFDASGIRGIVLDSNLIVAPEHVPGEAEAQLSWLQHELERAQRDHVENLYVFQHIPYFLAHADEPDQYYNVPLAIRRRYLELFHRFGVKCIFAGHYHQNRVAADGSLTMVTTGAVGLPHGQSRSGLRIVRVEDGSTESRFYDFGAVPDKIDPAKQLPPVPVSGEEVGNISQQ